MTIYPGCIAVEQNGPFVRTVDRYESVYTRRYSPSVDNDRAVERNGRTLAGTGPPQAIIRHQFAHDLSLPGRRPPIPYFKCRMADGLVENTLRAELGEVDLG